jgi:uncharacterized LabA/DUF88 family protein
MGRFAVFVDAGYLLQKSVAILSNKKSNSRGDLDLTDPAGLMKMLIAAAGKVLNNNDLLRVYWYDGVKGSMSPEHKAIVAVEDVQFRAGTINGQGQQKGVDSLIVTDLIELATHHAISDALLVTGDSDLAVGIELAQRRGVRVAVLGIAEVTGGVHHSQSAEITNIADRVVRIGKAEISAFLQYKPKLVVPAKAAAPATVPAQPAAPVTTMGAALSKAVTGAPPASQATPASKVTPPAAPAAASPGPAKLDAQTVSVITKAVDAFIHAQTPPFAKTIVTATGSIDHTADRGLLFAVFTALGGQKLDPQSKNCARASFRAKINALP